MSPASRALARYVARRAAMTGLTLFGLLTLVFLMTKIVPGDEALMIAGPDATPAQVAAVRERYGLDSGLATQYGRFLAHLAAGDLGVSTSTLQPVLGDLLAVLPATIELVAVTMIVSIALAAPAAALAAIGRGGAFDGTTRVAAVVAGGLPAFWVALMGQAVVAAQWGWLPISGQFGFGMAVEERTGMALVDTLIAGDGEAFRDAALHVVLPAVSLAMLFSAQLYRLLRASLIAALRADYIAPARAKGASFARLLLRHALPNALAPTVALAGMQIGAMIGSAVMIEAVFARPGVGAYLFNAVSQKDTFAVIGAVFFIGVVVCLVNFLVDLGLLALDPRVRAAELMGGRA